ncbi:hypothetical protein B0I35DRAFT_404442 [Stachybotrys elegans]|uniref:Uncharacterized protein n=1 Tax=Stachybotrys elegans TaxID=80388 RepID=A0A8K0T6W2_9HYPO|nr:hypothetical protein B0I35DRAFT_404442 [Stachybotrys elegans]
MMKDEVVAMDRGSIRSQRLDFFVLLINGLRVACFPVPLRFGGMLPYSRPLGKELGPENGLRLRDVRHGLQIGLRSSVAGIVEVVYHRLEAKPDHCEGHQPHYGSDDYSKLLCGGKAFPPRTLFVPDNKVLQVVAVDLWFKEWLHLVPMTHDQ